MRAFAVTMATMAAAAVMMPFVIGTRVFISKGCCTMEARPSLAVGGHVTRYVRLEAAVSRSRVA